MAALHPETVRLLRKTLADMATRHKSDLARLARLKVESKSLMAQTLRTRVDNSVLVMRDLETLAPSDTPPAQTEIQKAYRVLGYVMETVPSGFAACRWVIDVSYISGTCVKIQRAVETIRSDEAVRQSLRSVATVLGLTYAEDRIKDRIKVHAVGEIDGIGVEVWDAVELADGAQ